LKKAKAEANISIEFATESDAEAIVRALIPEMATQTTSRASFRSTRRGKATVTAFYARDLVALRAMVNSFLRFAATWRRLSEALGMSRNGARRADKPTMRK
jgi:tRNA threonylcarbamoyladenosine modification (KEOPS) complex  Pcc1 subunit